MNYNKIAVLGAVTIMTLGLASPSFALGGTTEEPCCEKIKGNNGLGNGDQPAPGNSRDKNGAENDDDLGHPSGKGQIPNN